MKDTGEESSQSQAAGLAGMDNNKEKTPIPATVIPSGLQGADNTHQQHSGSSLTDMSGMFGALPDTGYGGLQHPVYAHQAHASNMNTTMMYQYQNQNVPAAGTSPSNFGSSPYHRQVPLHMYEGPRMYAGYTNNTAGVAGAQSYSGQMFVPPQMMHSSTQAHFQHFPHYSQGSVYPQITGAGYPRELHQQVHLEGAGAFGAQSYHQMGPREPQSGGATSTMQSPGTLRGPPRKPKQSGHALWVGNLPPGTNIMDLKDHFSREATNDIESVFLISKSNCAFVNYKTELSCAAAMNRFHDSRFQGVRLVCRLRRGSAPGPSPSPSPNTSSIPVPSSEPQFPADILSIEQEPVPPNNETIFPLEKVPEKFFIIKSLTIEDLERSVHNGIWATQSHNEAALNKAFQSADNVYLIFSANKSGEYFGYARMDSAIDDAAAAALDMTAVAVRSISETQLPQPTDLPRTIPTAATETAPRGHVIDDSARGTIFWEASTTERDLVALSHESEPDADESESLSGGEDVPSSPTETPPSSTQTPPQSTTFGRPFKITWQSTERLPFYRTRGLRNPWNTNREVKIARDGTELETNVGRKLIGMFGTQPGPGVRPPQAPAYSMLMMPGSMGTMHGPGPMPGQGYPRPF